MNDPVSSDPIKVLVADDSHPVHHLFRSALNDHYLATLTHATTGAECLAALARGVDVAFIDIHMPEMSGIEALWGARARGAKTFVALMSGRRSQRCIMLTRQLDVSEVLLKPFREQDIRWVLESFQRVSTSLRVLLVDDSEAFRKIMRKVLDRSVFRLNVDEVGDGPAALAASESQRYDVIFLDCNMSGLDGLEVLVRMRLQNPASKVVMISGERDRKREQAAQALGAVAFLCKPFFPGEIDAVLHKALGMCSPQLATEGEVQDFGVRIHGRTIAVEHHTTGHVYEYIWFPHPPHLRLPKVRPNPEVATTPDRIRTDAEWAALQGLELASLIHGAAVAPPARSAMPRMQRQAAW